MGAQRGNTAVIVIVVIVGVFVVTCGLCGVLGMFGRTVQTNSPGPTLYPKLTLVAASGSEEELSDALEILERRLDQAGIPHAIDRHELKFSVRLPEDSLQVREAQRLLLAGGELWFKIVVQVGDGPGELSEAEWDAAIEKVEDAKKIGTYDPATSPYDYAVQFGFVPYLLENPGFPGYHVASARYLWTEAQGAQRVMVQLASAAPAGAQVLHVATASGLAPDQMLRVGRANKSDYSDVVRVAAVRGDSVELTAPLEHALPKQAPVKRGFFEIRYTMTPEGAPAYLRYARASSGKDEATLFDGEIETIATWGDIPANAQLSEWTFSNTTDNPWTEEQVRYFSTLMTSGRLPVELTLEYE